MQSFSLFVFIRIPMISIWPSSHHPSIHPSSHPNANGVFAIIFYDLFFSRKIQASQPDIDVYIDHINPVIHLITKR